MIPADLLKFSGIAMLLLVWGVFCVWKPRDPSPHPLFSRQRWTIGEAVIGLILVDVAMLFGGAIFDVTPDVWWIRVSVQLFIFAMPFLVLLGFYSYYLRQPLSVVGWDTQRDGSLSINGLIWSLWVCGAVWLILSLAPDQLAGEFISRFSRFNIDSVIKIYGALGGAFYYFGYTLWLVGFAVLTEELAYRGLFYGALRRRVTFIPAMIISSLCFTISHFELNPLLFGFGCLWAYLVEKHHSLIPAIVFHFVWDFTMRLHEFFIGGLHIDPASYFRYATVAAVSALVLAYVVAYLVKRRKLGSDSITIEARRN